MPLPPPATGASCGGGAILRTTTCCPKVQKLVVIQYTISPAGKLGMITANASGSSSMIRCWVLSTDTDITRLAAICDPT